MIKLGNGQFWNGDCLDIMKLIPSSSVDLILCDLPYGTTACKWDSVIPFEPLWEQYWRIAKPNAAIVLTAAQPFTTRLIASQIERFKYCWVWDKAIPSGFMNAKRKPLRTFEDICIFSKFDCANNCKNQMRYFPQDLKIINEKKKNSKRGKNGTIKDTPSRNGEYIQSFTNYPKDVIRIANTNLDRIHPTQKPVALFEYLIKTYTNPGEVVLDNCAGSGTTAIAAERTGRKWICIEKDLAFYLGAVGRAWKEVNK